MVLARASFEFVDPRRSLAVETTPIADIAILNSETSHIARSRQPNINETPLRGAFVSLLEGGWTSHILLEEDLASELGKYQTLVLPEQPVLDSETISRVREFVRAGGGLVVVGEMESSGKEFPLGEVLGLHPATGWEDDRAYVVIPDEWADALWPNFEPVRPKVLVLGAPTVVQTVEANALCPLTRAGVPYQLGVRAPAEATTFPALTLNEFGKGRAAYAALPLCSDYWRRGNSGAKHLLNGLVALVTPRPTVRVESDCSLEVTLARRGEETVVHLIAYHSERRAETPPVVERIPKSRNVLVHLRRETAPSSVVQQPESRELEWSYRDEAVTFPVPDFRLHTAVVVR
jgi:hypothetical protein